MVRHILVDMRAALSPVRVPQQKQRQTPAPHRYNYCYDGNDGLGGCFLLSLSSSVAPPGHCCWHELARLKCLTCFPALQGIASGLGQIAVWVFSLILVIGIFYSIVFYASGGLGLLLKDRITFTRKDFVPYSERRR